MTDVFLARQPIFDRTQSVTGYELLYRSGFMPRAVVGDGEVATARVALGALTDIGLDQLVGECAAWINVTRDFLLADLASSLPPERVVLELSEHEVVDQQLLDLISELRAAGYVVALDDFEYKLGIERLLSLVEVVKLDLMTLGADGLAREADRLRPYGVSLVAERVETHEDFEHSLNAGCDMFQGFFFCRPQFIKERAIAPSGLAMLRLASAIQDPAVELDELERLISSDVALSYRLLRYINSAYFGMRQQVASMMQAVALLGIKRVKQWAVLTAFAEVDGKTPELFLTALIRARFCQLAGQPIDGRPEERFTLGLFSVLDGLMDTTMETAVSLLPLPQRTREALVNHSGPGRLIDCVQAIEQGHFNNLARQLDHSARHYVAAIAWANETVRDLAAAMDPEDGADRAVA